MFQSSDDATLCKNTEFPSSIKLKNNFNLIELENSVFSHKVTHRFLRKQES